MKKTLILLLSIIITGSTIFGQSSSYEKAKQTLEERGEVYFKFKVENDEFLRFNIDNLTKIISIDNVNGNSIKAYANINEFDKFIDYGYDYEVLTPPSLLFKPTHGSVPIERNTNSWDYYPNYTEYLNMMNQFVTDYPNLCELVSIGTTPNDREILFIRINDNISVDENEPEFMYTSSMHGDELTGYVLMLRYIDYLLQNYGSDRSFFNFRFHLYFTS